MTIFRDFKIFIFGMITAFAITLIIYNANLTEQQFIAEVVQDAVIGAIVALIVGTFLRIGLSIFQRQKKVGA